MSLVATLICNPANPALDSTIVDGARAVLPRAAPAHWLFDGVAVDIPFGADSNLEGDRHAIEQRLRELRGDLPIDIVVQPVGFRRKKLFLADMDSTMIGQECIDELAEFVGLKAHVSAITEQQMRGEIPFEPAMLVCLRCNVSAITEQAMRGEIAFEPALRARVALLEGLAEATVDEVIAKR